MNTHAPDGVAEALRAYLDAIDQVIADNVTDDDIEARLRRLTGQDCSTVPREVDHTKPMGNTNSHPRRTTPRERSHSAAVIPLPARPSPPIETNQQVIPANYEAGASEQIIADSIRGDAEAVLNSTTVTTTSTNQTGSPTRVFVSYAHDSARHRRVVLRFCGLLRRLGIDVHVDEWDTDLRRDWFLWMIDQFRHADYVVVIASPEYRAAGDGNAPADCHRGVQTESAVLRNFIYRDREAWTRKILPVILPGRSADEIPLYLQPHCASHYHLKKINTTGVKEIARVLSSGQPDRTAPPVSTRRPESPHWSAAAVSTLPGGVPSFTGRDHDVQELMARIVAADQQDATAIHVVNGMPGVGKTAFAVHVAQQVADRFSDGHLFLELRGHTPGQPPVTPVDALGSLLLAIGVAARHIPADFDHRARMWRGRLAGRRMLLLLDDVVDHEQVRPLLPGTPGCQVVITSRRRLPGLEDAQPLPLTVLSPDQAIDMFLRLTHRTANDQERHQISELVRVCGHLPLAITLAAGRLRSHPTWDVRYLTDQMVSAQNRLAEIRADDHYVSTAFELSYRDLPTDVRRLFRRLSLHPGVDFDLYAAAALDGGDLDATRRLVETLYLNHLVEKPSPGRYRLHDLIQHYAKTLLAQHPDENHSAVIEQVLDYYLHVATAAARLLPHHDGKLEPSPGDERPTYTPDINTEEDASRWFADERVNLSSCIDYARGHHLTRHTVRLAAALHPYLAPRGHWDDALAIHSVAVRAAEHGRDVPGLAVSLLNLGVVQLLVDDYPSSMVNVSRAQRLYVKLGDRQGEASAIGHIGAVQYAMGEYPQATRNLTHALTLCAEIGDRFGEATMHYRLGILQHLTKDYGSALSSLMHAYTSYHKLGARQGEADALSYLGLVQGMAGDYPPALRSLARALATFEEIGDRRGEANALYRMGTLLRVLGEYSLSLDTELRAHALFVELASYQGQANTLCGLAMTRYLAGDRTSTAYATAVDTLERALALCVRIGDRVCEASVYNTLGIVQHLAGHYQNATASLTRALTLSAAIPDRTGQIEALNNLGQLAWDWPEAGDAFSHHQQALLLARDIGYALEEGRALERMGRCLIRNSYARNGRAYLHEALELYKRHGLPDADGVRTTLAELAATTDDRLVHPARRALTHLPRGQEQRMTDSDYSFAFGRW